MALSWTNCPVCACPLVRNENLIPGVVVLACKPCRRFCLEADDHWIEPFFGFGVETMLRERLDALNKARDPDEVWKQMVNSPSDDPRWTTV